MSALPALQVVRTESTLFLRARCHHGFDDLLPQARTRHIPPKNTRFRTCADCNRSQNRRAQTIAVGHTTQITLASHMCTISGGPRESVKLDKKKPQGAIWRNSCLHSALASHDSRHTPVLCTISSCRAKSSIYTVYTPMLNHTDAAIQRHRYIACHSIVFVFQGCMILVSSCEWNSHGISLSYGEWQTAAVHSRGVSIHKI